ncbi:hypothetical protein Ddc_05203 [Ditylenchus destructor]|nr:hypothetical protein Ddc_05203 [Ditylenchus destructor]
MGCHFQKTCVHLVFNTSDEDDDADWGDSLQDEFLEHRYKAIGIILPVIFALMLQFVTITVYLLYEDFRSVMCYRIMISIGLLESAQLLGHAISGMVILFGIDIEGLPEKSMLAACWIWGGIYFVLLFIFNSIVDFDPVAVSWGYHSATYGAAFNAIDMYMTASLLLASITIYIVIVFKVFRYKTKRSMSFSKNVIILSFSGNVMDKSISKATEIRLLIQSFLAFAVMAVVIVLENAFYDNEMANGQKSRGQLFRPERVIVTFAYADIYELWAFRL